MKAGFDPDEVNGLGRICVHEACLGGHSAVLQLLLSQASKNLNQTDKDGQTAAHLVAANGAVDCLQALYDKGMNNILIYINIYIY